MDEPFVHRTALRELNWVDASRISYDPQSLDTSIWNTPVITNGLITIKAKGQIPEQKVCYVDIQAPAGYMDPDGSWSDKVWTVQRYGMHPENETWEVKWEDTSSGIFR